jgi:hypothetical protein
VYLQGYRANHALSTVIRDSLRKVDVPSAAGFYQKELMPRTSQPIAPQRISRAFEPTKHFQTVIRDIPQKADIPSAAGLLLKELIPRTGQRFD